MALTMPRWRRGRSPRGNETRLIWFLRISLIGGRRDGGSNAGNSRPKVGISAQGKVCKNRMSRI